MAHVLLVDDEPPLRDSLAFTLRREGYEVTTAADGLTALDLARAKAPDVILLDLMLPGLDGMEVCRRIRSGSDVPILMLTAKDQEIDKILGLEMGADDYVTKPFSTRELLARMKSVMRRRAAALRAAQEDRESLARMEALVRYYAEGGAAPRDGEEPPGSLSLPGSAAEPVAPPSAESPGILDGNGVRMDLDRHEVTSNGDVIVLSPKEFQLLRALMSYRGRVLSREQLIESVWGDEFMGDPKTLDVHIRWLREKIERDPSDPRLIVTVRGVGYRFE